MRTYLYIKNSMFEQFNFMVKKWNFPLQLVISALILPSFSASFNNLNNIQKNDEIIEKYIVARIPKYYLPILFSSFFLCHSSLRE